MVIAVLRTGNAVQIDHDFDVVSPGPYNRLVEVLRSALDERLVILDIPAPVSGGDADVIEAGGWKSVLGTRGTSLSSPAICTKSSSVIKVSQCCFKAVSAVARS